MFYRTNSRKACLNLVNLKKSDQKDCIYTTVFTHTKWSKQKLGTPGKFEM